MQLYGLALMHGDSLEKFISQKLSEHPDKISDNLASQQHSKQKQHLRTNITIIPTISRQTPITLFVPRIASYQ